MDGFGAAMALFWLVVVGCVVVGILGTVGAL